MNREEFDKEYPFLAALDENGLKQFLFFLVKLTLDMSLNGSKEDSELEKILNAIRNILKNKEKV